MTTAAWAAMAVLALVAVDDLRHRRIRNRHVLALVVVTCTVVGIVAADEGGDVLVRASLGALAAAGPLLVASALQPGGIGGGDVKFAAVVGALVGSASPWLSVAAIGGALVVALAVTTVRAVPYVPLAPFLSAAAVLALLVSCA